MIRKLGVKTFRSFRQLFKIGFIYYVSYVDFYVPEY